jgi:hypothetical protein
MLIKIILAALCGVLWFLGGWGKESGNLVPWKGWRVVLIPIILGVSTALFMHGAWFMRLVIGVTTTASMNIIRIGYGNYDPEHDNKPSFLAKVTHDRGGWWIRAICGALYVLIGYLPYVLYSGRWWFYLLLAAVSAGIGFCVSRFKLKVKTTDLIIGSTAANILFML